MTTTPKPFHEMTNDERAALLKGRDVPTPIHTFAPQMTATLTPDQMAAERSRKEKERELRAFERGEITASEFQHPDNIALAKQWKESAARLRAEEDAKAIEAEQILASRRSYDAQMAVIARDRQIDAEIRKIAIEREDAQRAADRAEAHRRLGITDSEAA